MQSGWPPRNTKWALDCTHSQPARLVSSRNTVSPLSPVRITAEREARSLWSRATPCPPRDPGNPPRARDSGRPGAPETCGTSSLPGPGWTGVPPKLTACVILGAVHGVGHVDELVAGSLSAEFAVRVAQDHLASAEETPQPDLPVSKWKGTFTALPGPLKQDPCSPRGSHPGLKC